MKSDEEILGEYVIWLEANGNNFLQSMASAFMNAAPEWYASKLKYEAENGAPITPD
jgi:hypothetical protein